MCRGPAPVFAPLTLARCAVLHRSRSPPGSPPSSRTRAVGHPHPLMDAPLSSACHLIPAASVSPCSRRSRDSSPRSRDVCPHEEDALAWLGAEEAPRCSTSLCVGNKERICCPAAAFSGCTVAENCFFPLSATTEMSAKIWPVPGARVHGGSQA